MARVRRPRGYRTAIRGRSWWRDNRDGTITAKVVMTMWPELPDLPDDANYFDVACPIQELWTIQLPLAPDDWEGPRRRRPAGRRRVPFLASGPVYMLHDKPHRITWWDEDHPDRKILSSELLAGATAHTATTRETRS